MHWIAPSEKDTDNAPLEKRLWDATARELEATIADNVPEIREA